MTVKICSVVDFMSKNAAILSASLDEHFEAKQAVPMCICQCMGFI